MIEKRPFGRTGHDSTAVLFGAAALKSASQTQADGVLELLLRYGVNHIDTAPRYGDAELRIGPWMRERRKDFFLATKTDQRTYQGAREQIRRSLERLQTDHVDLLQFHALYHPDDWDAVFAPGGALEAAVEAREQGLTRFIGVTGHGWTIAAMHLRSLARFDFDSVLLPYNYLMIGSDRYRQDFDALLALCEQRNVAVQTIKSLARGPWATASPNHSTWYQPLTEQADIDLATHWAMARPGVFVNSVGDIDLLPKMLDAASRYPGRAPDDGDMEALLHGRRLTSLFGLSA